jgi:hypothetical protein
MDFRTFPLNITCLVGSLSPLARYVREREGTPSKRSAARAQGQIGCTAETRGDATFNSVIFGWFDYPVDGH